MSLGDQILDDEPQVWFPLRPWMVVNHKGFLLCLMCPIDRIGRDGSQYYLALRNRLRPKLSSRKTAARWLRAHRHCGFKGLMT